MAPDRLKQLLRIESYPILEDDLDVLDIRNLARRVAFDHDQIGILPWLDGSDCLFAAEIPCAVKRCDLDRVGGSEPCLHQQFDLTLIAEARQDVSPTGRIGARKKQTSGS